MNTTPDQPADDVEGHMPRIGRGVHATPDRDADALTESATEDDLEGHGLRGPEALDTETATEDDLEGHGLRGPEALDTETTEDDAEGHGRRPPG